MASSTLFKTLARIDHRDRWNIKIIAAIKGLEMTSARLTSNRLPLHQKNIYIVEDHRPGRPSHDGRKSLEKTVQRLGVPELVNMRFTQAER